MASKYPPREDIGHDQPLRLAVAAALAFPDGSMTASGLRRESARGRLVIERIAGKDYTTLANIEQMRAYAASKRGSSPLARIRGARRNVASSSVTPTWVIRDGPRKFRTGCAREDREGAERALAEYLASKVPSPARSGPSSR